MTEDVFKRIFEEYIKPLRPTTIIWHKDGEPLLSTKLMDYMKMVDQVYPTKFDIYTNGILLNHYFVKELGDLRSKVWILLSYHFFDYKGRFVDYTYVDKELLTILENCPDNVEIILATHATDFAPVEVLEGWKQKWEGLKKQFKNLSAVHVNTHINPWTGLIKQENMSHFPACPYSDGNHMFFGSTGNVIACCMDLEEEIILGNVMTDTPEDIAAAREAFYTKIQKNIMEYDVCRRCVA